jgi:hypothetical protein
LTGLCDDDDGICRRGRVLSPVRLNVSGGALQQLLGLSFELETRVLIGLGARQCGDPLYEIEDRFRRPPLFRQDHLNHLAGLAFREAAPTQDALTVVILARDDPFACRLDAGDERSGRWVLGGSYARADKQSPRTRSEGLYDRPAHACNCTARRTSWRGIRDTNRGWSSTSCVVLLCLLHQLSGRI